jgi:hypothetical protein
MEHNHGQLINLNKYVSKDKFQKLYLGSHSVSNFESGFLQYFHGIESTTVEPNYFPDKENLAERSLAEHLEELKLTRVSFVVALFDHLLKFNLMRSISKTLICLHTCGFQSI